jgi:hypothetical protein
MSYIGNQLQNQNYVPAIDYFSGNGSTTAFTLSRPVASVAQVQAVISNVPQNPGSAFTVSGSTITFTSAPPSGTNNIYVYYTSPNTQVVQPGQGTVSTTSIADGAVTAAKLASTTGTGAVALASLPTFTTTIGVGGATASASGSGVSFPATQSASSDANTLDDYEEGTWTPTASAATGTITSYSSDAKYVKVGRVVTVNGYVYLTNVGTAANSLYVSGLPFNFSPTNLGPAPSVSRENNITGQVYSAFISEATTNRIVIQSLSGGPAGWSNNYVYGFNLTYITTS